MRFVCERDLLLKEISIAQEVIASRNISSILSNILLETNGNTLIIKSSDVKVGFESTIPIEVSVQGITTIYCDKLIAILRSLPNGEIEFELDDSSTFIIKPLFKKINFKLRSIASEKYPEIPDTSDDNYFSFPQKDFLDMIRHTIFSISDDETRYFMNGVFFEKKDNQLIMVASDGRRLSYVAKTISAEFNFNGIIIPTKILNILKKFLTGEGNIYLSVSDKNFFAKFGHYKFTSNLIEGKFPNYEKVIPENQDKFVIIEKSELDEAIKRVSLLVEQKSRRIYLNLSENKILITSDDNEIGVAKEEIPCEYLGEEGSIVLNFLYILEPLREINEEKIRLEFCQFDKTITLKPQNNQDIVHIIMPMQKK